MKKYSRILGAMFCTALIISCMGKKEFGVYDVRWLEGTWRVLDGSGIESWKFDGKEMKGSVFSSRHKEYTEALRIYPGADKNLIFEATVKRQNDDKPVSFVLRYRSADSLQFINLSHDFPNFIEYKRVNDSTIFGNAYGLKESGYSFHMAKVKVE
jgi:hypothetical protein